MYAQPPSRFSIYNESGGLSLASPGNPGDSDEGEGGEDEDNEEVQTATDAVADTEAVNNHSQV